MTEKIIVSPQRVRCLGDVVSPKEVSDFDKVSCTLSSSSDTVYGTVYSESYLAGSTLSLVYDGLIGSGTESFTVSATLKNASGTAISGASVYLVVNDGEPTSATTNSSGGASFTVSTSDVTDYRFRVYYTGTSSICGSTAYGHVCVGDVTGLELHGNKSVIQTDESVGLWAKLVGTGALKGAVVKFYEQWTPNIRLSAEANPIQTGDTIDLSAQLVDSDGSLVREAGHTISFYEDMRVFTDNAKSDRTNEYTAVLVEGGTTPSMAFSSNKYSITGGSKTATFVVSGAEYTDATITLKVKPSSTSFSGAIGLAFVKGTGYAWGVVGYNNGTARIVEYRNNQWVEASATFITGAVDSNGIMTITATKTGNSATVNCGDSDYTLTLHSEKCYIGLMFGTSSSNEYYGIKIIDNEEE